ncbi:putative methyltransferase-domain-containing protein [Geopyxis carbonaria]|nr:putative methyltransferase-domain-containing protein [Geopyxis carbonaria]
MHEALNALIQQCLQLVHPLLIVYPPSETLEKLQFQANLHEALFSTNSLKYALPKDYARLFLKNLISRISNELHESILETYMNLLADPIVVDPSKAVAVTYTLPHFTSLSGHIVPTCPITIFETPSLLSAYGTTGLRTWEAAMALGEYFVYSITNKPHFQWTTLSFHDTVLELGAGTGLVSMILGRLGVSQVIATDGDDGVVEKLQKNINLNGLGSVVTTKALRWGQNPTTAHKISLMVGADVTYDKSSIPFLVAEIASSFITNPNMRVVISATMRNRDTFETFRIECAKARLSLRETAWESREPPVFYYSRLSPILIVHVVKED